LSGLAQKIRTLRKPSQLIELFGVFLKLGCRCFGGPVAHLGYFHAEFVRRRQWLDEEQYTDLVALCNFLPGPASSQTVFAIGMKRAGLAGALAASIGFLLPSAGLMMLFGYGLTSLGDFHATGWLHGLKIAAAAVVAQAVWQMAQRLCPDFPRAVLALAVAGIVFVAPVAYAQIGALMLGAGVGFFLNRISSPHTTSGKPKLETKTAKLGFSHRWAILALTIYFALLLLLPVLAAALGTRSAQVLAGFYHSGALVFGGGHVVLPLLRAEVVPPGWINDSTFLAGYGVAQALPGPLFAFAAYLGVVIFAGPYAWLGGLACLLAIYLPAWLVVDGALPFWHTLREQSWAQGLLRGANAAVVGILLAALITPIGTEAIGNLRDLGVGVAAWLLLEKYRMPPWAIVALSAAAGQWLL